MKLAGVLGQSRKVVAHLVGAEITWATLSLQHGFGRVTFTEWIAQAILLATALGVYSIANDPAASESKASSGSDGTSGPTSAPSSSGSNSQPLYATVTTSQGVPNTALSYSLPPSPATSNPTPAPVAAEPSAPAPSTPPEGWASTPAPAQSPAEPVPPAAAPPAPAEVNAGGPPPVA